MLFKFDILGDELEPFTVYRNSYLDGELGAVLRVLKSLVFYLVNAEESLIQPFIMHFLRSQERGFSVG